MASDILLSNGIVNNLDSLARQTFPEKAFGTKNYVITDTIVDDVYGDLVMNKLKSAGLEVYKSGNLRGLKARRDAD
eukprot:3437215-Rhodomonas_salina.1